MLYVLLLSTEGLQNLLHHCNTLLLQELSDGVTDLLGVWRQDTRCAEYTVQHELRRDTARDANCQSHSGVTVRITVDL